MPFRHRGGLDDQAAQHGTTCHTHPAAPQIIVHACVLALCQAVTVQEAAPTQKTPHLDTTVAWRSMYHALAAHHTTGSCRHTLVRRSELSTLPERWQRQPTLTTLLQWCSAGRGRRTKPVGTRLLTHCLGAKGNKKGRCHCCCCCCYDTNKHMGRYVIHPSHTMNNC